MIVSLISVLYIYLTGLIILHFAIQQDVLKHNGFEIPRYSKVLMTYPWIFLETFLETWRDNRERRRR